MRPEVQLRIEELASIHTALARAFGEAGIGGTRLEGLFKEQVKAECLGCGIIVSGEDLGHITVVLGEPPTVDNKLDRLRLGYCARNGCSSRYYRLTCGA